MSVSTAIRARESGGTPAPQFDGLLLAAVLALAAVGAVMVYSASAIPASQSRRLGSDEFYYLKRQLVAGAAGLVLLVAALRIGHRRLAAFTYPLLGLTVLALSLVPLVGKTAGGAQRWIPLGPVQFQPAEAAKVVLVLYLAHSLARKQDRIRDFSIGVLPHLIVTGVLAALCLVQRDLGTGVILFLVLLAMLFAAGARVGYLLVAAGIAAAIGWQLVKSTPYRWQRVLAFLEPERYRAGAGFQLWESLLGTANGGFLGQGLGQGKGKLFYLPAAHTDFIAAVIAEEAGLLGMILLLALYAVVVWRGLRAALYAADAFGCYAALGVTTLVGAQAIVNLAVVFGLLPTKGLTLPFVSYGGSSLMTMLGAAGVLLSVSGERGGFLRRPAAATRIAPERGALRRAGGTP
ncbi:MAG TPA: putative lipid II flippase FtsW [Anaeromyxobacter sp.]